MAYRKLGRTSGHRKSMLRNLTTDVIVNARSLQLNNVLKKFVVKLKR